MDSGFWSNVPHNTRGLGFIPGSLEDMDKHIEDADVHHVMAKQKVQVQIKMYKNIRDPLIATLHNVLLAPDL